MDDLEISSAEALWAWLSEHHASPVSVRLVTWKAHHPRKYVSRDAVLDALLAHGWIDGRRFRVDEDRTAQLISRRKQQAWAKTYKERVEKLRAAGRMHPAGEAAVAQAKALGLWEFYDDVDALVVPSDLGRRLHLESWEALPKSYRRNLLRWLKHAKTETTRAKRIGQICEATEAGRRLAQM